MGAEPVENSATEIKTPRFSACQLISIFFTLFVSGFVILSSCYGFPKSSWTEEHSLFWFTWLIVDLYTAAIFTCLADIVVSRVNPHPEIEEKGSPAAQGEC